MTPRLWWLLAGCSFVVISVGIGTVHIARWEGNDQIFLWKLAMIVVFTPIPLFPAAFCFSRFARLPSPEPHKFQDRWTQPTSEPTYSPYRSHWSD